MPKPARKQPDVLTSTAGMSREEWLAFRRQGIGGSDAASVLGISPFRTGVDLYYDKLGLPVEDSEENWVAMEMGNLLEDLVARIFAKKTGLKVSSIPVMFRHPDHPWMLADIDRLVTLPDGSSAILECKTTNYNARDKWEYDGRPVVPPHYEAQGRHYMAVMDLNRVYYCCLYGNNEDEVIIRHIDRDMAYESELIVLEKEFWENHVQAKTPPPYIEDDGELILRSMCRCWGPSRMDAPPSELTQAGYGHVLRYLKLKEEKSGLDGRTNKLDKELERLKALIVADMGGSDSAVYTDESGSYTVTFRPSRREGIRKESLIARNAKLIREGSGELLYGRDFVFLGADSQQEAAEIIRRVYCRERGQRGAAEVQILTPYRSTGDASANSLNTAIREEINPPAADKPELDFGGRLFRLGDRVMQTKNDYDISLFDRDGRETGRGVFNGEVGRVCKIGSGTVTVDFEGRFADCPLESLGELELAYTTTVHKSQGSEYDTVIVPILPAHKILLSRNLFYTAVTRAKLRLFWLAAQIVYRGNSKNGEKIVDLNGKNLRDVLQIDPSDLPWLQQSKSGIRDLFLLRLLHREGHRPSGELFAWLDAHNISELDCFVLALPYTTPHKLTRYLDGQFAKHDLTRYPGVGGILSDYKDYLGFCEELHYDMKNEFVLFPKRLKAAHDEAHGRIKQKRVEQYDAQIAAMRDGLMRKYQFSAGGLVVLPPRSAQEIVVEGQKLHHCVGGYAQRMAEDKCTILFIRKEERKEKPFYTVEVRGEKIIQIHGRNNCAPNQEVQTFLDTWKRKKHLTEAA